MAEFLLKKVELRSDVYMICLQQALSTEKLEVMGLLLGEIVDGVAHIEAVNILRRLDKRKDRVEISPEQMVKAVVEADRLSKVLRRHVRVVGWYHSHPHITVYPSHVDVRTQAMYQNMEKCFVGLIFSVFSESKESKEQEISVMCFQSRNEEATEIPLEIVYTQIISNTCLEIVTNLMEILVQEEDEMAETYKNNKDILASIHNNAVSTRTLVHITDIITKPLILTFETRITLNELRAAFLRKQIEELQMDESKVLFD